MTMQTGGHGDWLHNESQTETMYIANMTGITFFKCQNI